ncbi:MAG: hypothetical protein IAE94_11580 [Chthoniobacterales bacterium]|nr:hypothetical protein [Chthoniobacterales bacterium]
MFAPSPNVGRKNEPAFTVLELLAAVGILLVLAALLVPVGKAVLAGANGTRCAGNLRQLGAVFQAAAGENNGLIKFQSYTVPLSTKRFNNYLIEGGYLDANNKIAFCPSLSVVNGVRALGNGGYVYGGIIIADPTDPHSAPFDGMPNSRAIRLNTIERPAEYWLLTDSWSIPNNHQIYFINKDAAAPQRMHLRHNGKANMLFADGHVSAVDLSQTAKFPINPLKNAFDLKRQPVSE